MKTSHCNTKRLIPPGYRGIGLFAFYLQNNPPKHITTINFNQQKRHLEIGRSRVCGEMQRKRPHGKITLSYILLMMCSMPALLTEEPHFLSSLHGQVAKDGPTGSGFYGARGSDSINLFAEQWYVRGWFVVGLFAQQWTVADIGQSECIHIHQTTGFRMSAPSSSIWWAFLVL